MSDDLIKRLRAYNPPNRTVDEQRQIAVDIHEAADALEAADNLVDGYAKAQQQMHEDLGSTRNALEAAQQRIAELELWQTTAYQYMMSARERIAELEQDAKKAGYLRICCGKWESCQKPCYPRGERAGRLAGLREALEAVRSEIKRIEDVGCTMREARVGWDCYNGIQALIDAATKA